MTIKNSIDPAHPKYESVTSHLPVASDDTLSFLKIASKLLPALYREGCYYKSAGVIITGLGSSECSQPDLFQEPDINSKKVNETLDLINSRYGKGSLFSAAEGTDKPWRMKSEKSSPGYTTSWNELLEVR